jgi:hypothetical protein
LRIACVPIDTGRLDRLNGFLGAVSPALAARLAQAVEIDRLHGGLLPHDAILGSLRDQLKQGAGGSASRTPTPQRMVCAPFEDMLSSAPRLRKQRGRISRSSIEPVWTWLTGSLMPDEAPACLEAIRLKMVAGPEFAHTPIAAFQQLAAGAILKALPAETMQDERCATAVAILGRDVAGDAYDMARAMQIGPELRQLKRLLPKPLSTLTEQNISSIRGVWEQVTQSSPSSAPYVAFVIMGRLERPWEILKLAGALSRKMDDILISQTDLGLVGELLMADLEDSVARLQATRAADFRADDLLPAIVAFARISSGVVRELGIRRDGIWGKRLMALRGAMSAQMERLLARAVKDITVTLPMRRPGFSLRARRIPDMTKPLDPLRQARADEVARLISGSRQSAMAGAFAGLLKDIDEAVAETLRHYTTEMLDELRDAPDDMRPQAQSYVDHATLLTRYLLGDEEADLLRRRAAAAQSLHGGQDDAHRVA